jgi:hypothetical protein
LSPSIVEESAVALSQKHRSSLYQHLAPILGEEEAEALLSQFPSSDLDVPATKDFVRAEIAIVRTEIADLRAEMNDRFRAQTIWMASAMAIGMGIAAGLGRL